MHTHIPHNIDEYADLIVVLSINKIIYTTLLRLCVSVVSAHVYVILYKYLFLARILFSLRVSLSLSLSHAHKHKSTFSLSRMSKYHRRVCRPLVLSLFLSVSVSLLLSLTPSFALLLLSLSHSFCPPLLLSRSEILLSHTHTRTHSLFLSFLHV